MQLPRTVFTLPIAISENTPYTNQPSSACQFYRTPEEMADKEIVKCMFINEPEILDAAIEKIPAEFYERYSINNLLHFTNSLKGCRHVQPLPLS